MLNLNNYVNIKFKPCQENHAMHRTMFLTFPVAINILSVKNHSEKYLNSVTIFDYREAFSRERL